MLMNNTQSSVSLCAGDGWVDEKEFAVAGWGAPVSPGPLRTVVLMPAEEVRPSGNPRVSENY